MNMDVRRTLKSRPRWFAGFACVLLGGTAAFAGDVPSWYRSNTPSADTSARTGGTTGIDRGANQRPAARPQTGQPQKANPTGVSAVKKGPQIAAPGFDWTRFNPSPDTRTVYVSSSQGNDSNDGLSPSRPVRTIERAKQIVRHGYPDWVLLKRGDTFNTGLGAWRKGGRSAAEPLIISTYGDGARPLLKPTGAAISVTGSGGTPSSLDNIAIIGLNFYAESRDPNSPRFAGAGGDSGFYWVWRGRNILVEDCVFSFFKNGVMLTGVDAGVQNFRLRGCVITDSYNTSGHSQGIYATNVHGLLVEGCVFDHNGWNTQVSGGQPTIYNHNLYIDDVSNWGETTDVTVRGNIIANAASHGCQLRPGGEISGNVFVSNSLGMFVGLAPSAIRNNVLLEPKDISSSLRRGYGIDVLQCEDAIVENNIVAHKPSNVGTGSAIRITTSNDMTVPSYDVTVRNNIVFNWNGPLLETTTDRFDRAVITNNDFQTWNYSSYCVQLSSLVEAPRILDLSNNRYYSASSTGNWFRVSDSRNYDYNGWRQATGESGSVATRVQYADPHRTIGTYHASLGRNATTAAFLANARQQSRLHWRPEYTANRVINYIRAGFAD